MSVTQVAAGGLQVAAANVTLANCRLPVMVLPGHNGNKLVSEAGYMGNWCDTLAGSGFACLGLDAGGPTNWGGPACMAALDSAYAAISRSQVIILAESMGGPGALNWTKRNASKVQQVVLLDPVTDLAWAYGLAGYTPAYASFAPGAWTSEINAVFTNWAGTAGYRVYDEYATWRGLGVPITVISDTADTVVPPASRDAFVAGVNDPLVTLYTPSPTGGHVAAPSSLDGKVIAGILESHL